jgi:endoglucanase
MTGIRPNRRVALLAMLFALLVPATLSGMDSRAEAAVTGPNLTAGRSLYVTPKQTAVRGVGALAAATGTVQNPFAAHPLYVDPSSTAAQAAAAVRTSDPVTSALLGKVARGAAVDWFTGSIPASTLSAAVTKRTAAIRATGALPVFVVYDLPHRDCGSYSAGGAGTAAEYQAWIRAFAAGLLTAPAAVIVEPDALAQLTCLPAAQQFERLALLRYAVATLGAHPGVGVYLDAGHAGWTPVANMAYRLQAAGVLNARGFSLNVSFFDTTSSETAYGSSLSAALRGSHFVIDTSRNGRGIAPGREWCNPAGRGLGALPGSRPTSSLVDSYLWVKHPGYSDGTCNGGPAAGQWFPSYARSLGALAAW